MVLIIFILEALKELLVIDLRVFYGLLASLGIILSIPICLEKSVFTLGTKILIRFLFIYYRYYIMILKVIGNFMIFQKVH